MSISKPVIATTENLTLPTYPLGKPEKHPLFFEKRVYQGSSGKVYPVPFIDKVYDEPIPVDYQSVRLENDFVRLVLLPEIGGRIFIGQDKTNNDYDFFYRQEVIKPALVGLAGPWISGGVEFNWPQHHRPATYLPTDFWIEEESDGARTVWMSDHDPMNHLKGMHGIRLRPNSALIELRARLYNRTPLTHTFLWWANVAARVHDQYQSFFPEDVHYVADHAVRAMSSFPVAENFYYGMDYAARPGQNDLSWYKNIPVPTSYMVCQTAYDFFGGYDHAAQSGFLHVADRHVAPGKKQWTWGNHAFGWAWDRELTNTGGPYVELMAGVYTDNQPDFTYLKPGEVKTFTQNWWPYQQLGPVQEADTRLAIRLQVNNDRTIHAGVASAEVLQKLTLCLTEGDHTLEVVTTDLAPGKPWLAQAHKLNADSPTALRLEVRDANGRCLLAYQPKVADKTRLREQATEPPQPTAIESNDTLYLTGEHLEQYRHPTRYPEQYWQEALRRDSGDARCNLALGKQALQRGRFSEAETYLRQAIGTLTHRHPNPETGEAHYFLGITLRFINREAEAYACFAKAAWDYAWRTPSHLEMATYALRAEYHKDALQQAESALDTNRLNNRAQIIGAIALRHLGNKPEAEARLANLLKTDPLDFWANWEAAHGDTSAQTRALHAFRNDAQTILDIAFDYADCGEFSEAITLLELHHANPSVAVAVPNPMASSPMTHYTLAWLYQRIGDSERSAQALKTASAQATDYFFPSRLHEQCVLEWALSQAQDASAAYALGNYCYDRKRYEEAIGYWEITTQALPTFAVAHRNLGIAYWNIRQDGAAARAAYQQALEHAPHEARLVAEYNQLCEKLGDSAANRLAFCEAHLPQVMERDDACVDYAHLLNDTTQPERALKLLENRRFHPWEGGEGKVLKQYSRACLLIGEKKLARGDAQAALDCFEKALNTPENLGEAYHLLQAKADVNYWQGKAHRALGNETAAHACFEASANESGDFQNMAVTAHSELSYYRALSLAELGRIADAQALLQDLKAFAQQKKNTPAKIDYFATSLPNLLVFEESLDAVKNREADHLTKLADKALKLLNGAH